MFHDGVDSMKADIHNLGRMYFLISPTPNRWILSLVWSHRVSHASILAVSRLFYGRRRSVFPSPSFLPNILYHGHASCHSQWDPLLIMRPEVITAWKSYIVCTHAFGTGSFLCMGAGADKVKAAVCTIYDPCLSKMTSKKRTWRNHDERQSSSSRGANCKELYGKRMFSLLRHWERCRSICSMSQKISWSP